MELKGEVLDCKDIYASVDIIKDIFEGYLKPEKLLSKDDVTKKVKNAISAI